MDTEMMDIASILIGKEGKRCVEVEGFSGKKYKIHVEHVRVRQYMRVMSGLQGLQDLMGDKYEDAAIGSSEWMGGLLRVGGTEEGEVQLAAVCQSLFSQVEFDEGIDPLDEFEPEALAAVLLPFSVLQMQKFGQRMGLNKGKEKGKEKGETAE